MPSFPSLSILRGLLNALVPERLLDGVLAQVGLGSLETAGLSQQRGVSQTLPPLRLAWGQGSRNRQAEGYNGTGTSF